MSQLFLLSQHLLDRLFQRLRCPPSLLEQVLQTALLRLQIRVAANVLLGNEDVGDCALARQVCEDGLDRGSVIYPKTIPLAESSSQQVCM